MNRKLYYAIPCFFYLQMTCFIGICSLGATANIGAGIGLLILVFLIINPTFSIILGKLSKCDRKYDIKIAIANTLTAPSLFLIFSIFYLLFGVQNINFILEAILDTLLTLVITIGYFAIQGILTLIFSNKRFRFKNKCISMNEKNLEN